ncbi:MAG: LptF/LptG family permease [Elusimicrobia bacterium]|nr:LptF/LptG family permease [Elusimicrobiota bacterium]
MILNRTIAWNFSKSLLYSVLLFAFVIQMGHLFDRLEVFTKNAVPLKVIAAYLVSMLPLWLMQALPVCTLIAGVIVIGNMSISGELFCLRSSGIPSRIVLKPLFAVGILLTILTFVVGDWVMPKTTSYARSLYRSYVDRVGIQKPVWEDVVVLASNRRRISAKRLDLGSGSMEDVTVEEFGERLSLRQTLTAKKAEWNAQNGWTFYDGVVRLFSKEGDEIVEEEEYAAARIEIQEKPGDLVPSQVLPEELSTNELKRYIQKIESLGISPLKERVQYHLKIAFPFTHLLVLTIGLPIAFKATPAGGGRGRKNFGRMRTLALALAVTFSYYIFITLGQALGESRRMPPFLGVWIANFVFLAAGIHFLRKID